MINYYKLISLFSIQIVLSSDLPCIIDEEHFVPDRFNRGVAKKNWKRKTERRSENFALQQKPKTAFLGGKQVDGLLKSLSRLQTLLLFPNLKISF